MADEQEKIIIYRQGVGDGRRSGYACATRSLFKSWLVATLVSGVIMAIAPGEKNWRTVLATTGTGGSVGFFVAWLMDKRLGSLGTKARNIKRSMRNGRLWNGN